LPPLPVRDFEGVVAGVSAFQTTESDESIEGNAEERLVMTNKTARARRLFRSRRAASLRRGLRKSRKVRLLVVIVGVQLDRVGSISRREDAYLFVEAVLVFLGSHSLLDRVDVCTRPVSSS